MRGSGTCSGPRRFVSTRACDDATRRQRRGAATRGRRKRSSTRPRTDRARIWCRCSRLSSARWMHGRERAHRRSGDGNALRSARVPRRCAQLALPHPASWISSLQRGGLLVICEVKTRRGSRFGGGVRAPSMRGSDARCAPSARSSCSRRGRVPVAVRFDVASVRLQARRLSGRSRSSRTPSDNRRRAAINARRPRQRVDR